MWPAAWRAVPALEAALKTNGEWVGEQVAHALGEVGSDAKGAIPDLLCAAKGPDLLKKAAMAAVKKIAPDEEKPPEPYCTPQT